MSVLQAKTQALEAVTILDSTYVLLNADERLGSDGDGFIILQEWCSEAGVVKIRAQLSLRKANKFRPGGGNPYLELSGSNGIRVQGVSYDSDGDDVVGLEWQGKITEDEDFKVVLKTAVNQDYVVRENSAWVAFEHFPSTYPHADTFEGCDQ